jgi:hypothetical protein
VTKKENVMLVERNVSPGRVEIIGEAYDIAAYYLAMTGMIPPDGQVHNRLLEIVCELFHSGARNKLLLANKAIMTFERSKPVSPRWGDWQTGSALVR